MNHNEQLYHLNCEVKCRLGQSKIHGVGVFALEDIKKGENLFTNRSFNPQFPLDFPRERA